MAGKVDWNPDPRWPEHIVCLAKAIADGEDCRYALKDALLEEGLNEAANWLAKETKKEDTLGTSTVYPIAMSWLVGYILRDGGPTIPGGGSGRVAWVEEVKEYLAKRG